MKTETKYNIHDEVFILHDNKVKNEPICGIELKVDFLSKIKVNYIFRTDSLDEYSLDESKVFKTKQELIESL